MHAGSGELREIVDGTVEGIRSLAGGRFRDDAAAVALRLE